MLAKEGWNGWLPIHTMERYQIHSCVTGTSPPLKTQVLSAINSLCQCALHVSPALPRKKKGLFYMRKNSELSNKNDEGADPGGAIDEGAMSQGTSCIRERVMQRNHSRGWR